LRWSGLPEFRVAVCGFNGGLIELLVAMIQHAMGAQARITLTEYDYVQQLRAAAKEQSFDLFIVFLNSTLPYSGAVRCLPGLGDLAFLAHLRSTYRKAPLVIHNGMADYSPDDIMRAGAGGVLQMPFPIAQFMDTLRTILGTMP
jgi:hypothetical protein